MNNFNEMDYLVIDKAGDFLYFKDQAEISKYFDIPVGATYNIALQNRTRKYQEYHHKHKIYIQRLYNNKYSRQPGNTEFIWDEKKRNNFHNQNITFNRLKTGKYGNGGF
tara:strand:+ start:253 stop:579 length:327 start_codon:yes stop_codon:yes gene_type:complete